MRKKSLQQVLSQIEALQRQAEQLRSEEVQDVIGRIREAIDHYNLTPQDLFPTKKGAKRGKANLAEKPAKTPHRTKAASSKRGPGTPKYADPSGSGKTWTGQGKRPAWFVAAVETGKPAEDLLIK